MAMESESQNLIWVCSQMQLKMYKQEKIIFPKHWKCPSMSSRLDNNKILWNLVLLLSQYYHPSHLRTACLVSAKTQHHSIIQEVSRQTCFSKQGQLWYQTMLLMNHRNQDSPIELPFPSFHFIENSPLFKKLIEVRSSLRVFYKLWNM